MDERAIEAAARAIFSKESQHLSEALNATSAWTWEDVPAAHDKYREVASAAIAAYEAEMWRPIEEASDLRFFGVHLLFQWPDGSCRSGGFFEENGYDGLHVFHPGGTMQLARAEELGGIPMPVRFRLPLPTPPEKE